MSLILEKRYDKITEFPLLIITSFLAGAMLSVLMWWLEANRPYSPEKIDAIFQ